jgi:acyl-CoA synthetase
MSHPEWGLRRLDPDLARRYRDHGWWTDECLGSVLDRQLRAHPQVAFTFRSAERPTFTTFGEMSDLSRRVAGGLRRAGVGPGDVVAFQTPNWVEGAATFYAAAMLGAVVVPIVHVYGAKELRYILRQTGVATLVIADRFGASDYLANLAAVQGDADRLERVFVVGDQPTSGPTALPDGTPWRRFEELVTADPLLEPAQVSADDPAIIGYTSGTTADPKGVIHSHNTALAEVRQLIAMAPGATHPPLVAAPIGHAIGMLAGLLTPLLLERPAHLMDHWDPGEVLATMAAEQLSVSGGVPYYLLSLLDHPECTPEHHRLMGAMGMGGAAVPSAVSDRAAGLGIRLLRAYGSTEEPSITGSTVDDPVDKGAHTDGRPLPGNELRLVGPDGAPVDVGQIGEVVSRGPDLCLGFTDAALLAAAFDADGWYHTGDLAVLDADGFLTIVDRLKDVIIRGGENVSALEVEAVLLSLAGVVEVAVVAAPDQRLGEHGCAFLRLAPDAPEPSLDDLRAHLERAGLARPKWPEEIRIVSDLPRTPAGKVKKFVLRDELRAQARQV